MVVQNGKTAIVTDAAGGIGAAIAVPMRTCPIKPKPKARIMSNARRRMRREPIIYPVK